MESLIQTHLSFVFQLSLSLSSSHLISTTQLLWIILLFWHIIPMYVEALYSLLMYPHNSIIDKVHGYSNLCWIDLLFVAGTTRQRRRKSPITSYATVNSGCSALCQLSKQEQWWWWFRIVVNHRPLRFAKGWYNKASTHCWLRFLVPSSFHLSNPGLAAINPNPVASSTVVHPGLLLLMHKQPPLHKWNWFTLCPN